MDKLIAGFFSFVLTIVGLAVAGFMFFAAFLTENPNILWTCVKVWFFGFMLYCLFHYFRRKMYPEKYVKKEAPH